MKKIFLLIIVSTLCWLKPCQGQSLVDPSGFSLDVVTRKLEKANEAFSKSIGKFNKKLEKRLKKLYPDFKKEKLDSLLASKAKVLSGSPGQLPAVGDSVRNKVPIGALGQVGKKVSMKADPTLDNHLGKVLPNHMTGGVSDSLLLIIHQIKDELTAKMKETPSKMELYQKLEVSLGQLDKTEALYKQLKLPNMQLGLPDLPKTPSVPQVEAPKMGSWKEFVKVKELESLEEHARELSGALDKYKNEFKGLDQKLLAEVSSLEEVKWLQEQQKKMEAYQPLPEGYREKLEGFQTNDFVKEQLKKKAEEIAKVGGKPLEERLAKAQGKLADFKKKFTNLESVAEAPKRPPNPMKGKSLKERVRLGGNFQVNRQQPTAIDVSLRLSYLLSDKMSTGVGGAYRIVTNGDIKKIDFRNEMFGIRYHIDYLVYKSFFAQTVIEMNRKRVESTNDASSVIREWVPSAFIGAGRKFSLGRKLKGNMSLLYNMLHNDDSPYRKPLVFRVGFDL